MKNRKAFEDVISGPPYERSVERFGNDSAWPGSYADIDVDLAWCIWEAAVDKCIHVCKGVAAGHTRRASMFRSRAETHEAGQRDGAYECAVEIERCLGDGK